MNVSSVEQQDQPPVRHGPSVDHQPTIFIDRPRFCTTERVSGTSAAAAVALTLHLVLFLQQELLACSCLPDGRIAHPLVVAKDVLGSVARTVFSVTYAGPAGRDAAAEELTDTARAPLELRPALSSR